MPGSIPASDPPQVTAFTRLQKRRAPTPPPSLPLFIFLISICWSPVRSDAGAAHDATATAAVLKCKPEAVKLSGVGGVGGVGLPSIWHQLLRSGFLQVYQFPQLAP